MTPEQPEARRLLSRCHDVAAPRLGSGQALATTKGTKFTKIVSFVVFERCSPAAHVHIRPEAIADIGGIADVHRRAFGGSVEATLVDALRQQARPLVSLVAFDGDTVVGHILFSPVTLSSRPELPLMGLAPMAVLPSFQRRGVGSALVRAGLDECRRLGRVACVVLGHPAFYPRFGFSPASGFGLTSEYDVADEVFMAIELQAGALRGQAGTIRYHPAFAALS